jgi:hypothetical protein
MTWNNLNASQQQALVFASKHVSIIINELVEAYQTRKSIATVELSTLIYDKIMSQSTGGSDEIKVDNVVVSVRAALEHGFIVGVEGRKKAGLVKVGDIKWNNAFEFGEMKVSGKHYKKSKSVEEVVVQDAVVQEAVVTDTVVAPEVEESSEQAADVDVESDVDTLMLPDVESDVDVDSLVVKEVVQPSANSISLHLELPKLEEKKKRGGFPVGMIRTGGGSHGPRKDPLERAKANPRSKKLAIYATCFDCQGGSSDSGVVKRIRECAITRCPLLSHRPYQKTKANTIEELTEVDVLDESIDTDMASE